MKEQAAADDGGAQPELDVLLGRLQPGDVLVVPQLASLARSLPDLVRTLQQVAATGAGLHSLAEAVDAGAPRRASPNGPHGDADAALSRPTLDDDRGMPDPLNASPPTAPPPLRRRGERPPKLSWQQQGAVLDEVLPDRHTAADMARRYKASEATISRLLAAHRAESSAASVRGQVGTDAALLHGPSGMTLQVGLT